MLIAILQHTPIWVWALLATLLTLGLLQTRSRRVATGRLLALPLALLGLGLWSLWPSALALPAQALCWVLALGAGAWLGRRLPLPAGTRWLAEEGRLLVGGSWWPMALILLIFGLRYASGVGLALNPVWRTEPAVQLPLALLFGSLSGLFVGRTLRLLALRAS